MLSFLHLGTEQGNSHFLRLEGIDVVVDVVVEEEGGEEGKEVEGGRRGRRGRRKSRTQTRAFPVVDGLDNISSGNEDIQMANSPSACKTHNVHCPEVQTSFARSSRQETLLS